MLAYWRETVMEKMVVEFSWLHSECFQDLSLGHFDSILFSALGERFDSHGFTTFLV